MPKFFRFPWASTGDKTTIPDETDVAGFVSYQQGYGNDYARDPASDPLAKLIELDKTNQLYSDLTENAQYWQTHAFPEYITAAQNGGVAYAYDIGAIVRWTDNKNYRNTVAANTDDPATGGWVLYNDPADAINSSTEKTTPVDADQIGIVDSEDLNVLKKLTLANLKSVIPNGLSNFLHIQDQKPSGTGGGSYPASQFSTRVLNTILTNNIIGASLASNIITLPAGKYYIEAYGSAVGDNGHVQNSKVKIRNVTDNTDLLIGSSESINVIGTGSLLSSSSRVSGIIELVDSKNIKLDQWFTYAVSYSGGVGISSGVVEVFAEIKIWKVD